MRADRGGGRAGDAMHNRSAFRGGTPWGRPPPLSSFIGFEESDERPMNPRYSKEYRKRVHRFSLIFNENPP